MTRIQSLSTSHIPRHLYDLIVTEFRNNPRAFELFNEFFRHTSYSRAFALALLESARGKAGDSWDLRRLAALMLEQQVCMLPAEDIDEYNLLFTWLNLKGGEGAHTGIKESVLKEGYSSTDLSGFIVEFRRKIDRLARVHARIKGKRTSKGALRDFIALSRRDCKLSLARFSFSPGEVIERILSQVKISNGLRDLHPLETTYLKQEVKAVLARTPDFEAKILGLLCHDYRIYWVSESTSSKLNSLVEYPLGTVALVIKPPGSSIEFEIKRVGRRGANPLNIVYSRNGKPVPFAHRLDGASLGGLLKWEAAAAYKFSIIYHLAHGTYPAFSNTFSISSMTYVPTASGEAHILDYFTQRQIFGAGYREMRLALKESIRALKAEQLCNPIDRPSEFGLTVQFLSTYNAQQSVLSGSSSFRLDKLASYLSDKGPEEYFGNGLEMKYTREDAKSFADEILEEVLGVYQPPPVRYRSQKQYVDDAVSVAANRARADHNYLFAMQQIGKFWGTLSAARGYSWGESFVERNVGLKSCWEGGQWAVRIIFMDHDSLHLPPRQAREIDPGQFLKGMTSDEKFIFGRSPRHKRVRGAVDCLNEIYRVGTALKRKGKILFKKQMVDAYRKTQDALIRNPDPGHFFRDSFLERLRDWDLIVEDYLKAKSHSANISLWELDLRKRLKDKGYEEASIEEHLKALATFEPLLRRYRFLYAATTALVNPQTNLASHLPAQ